MTHHVQAPSTEVPRVLTPGNLDDALAALAEPDARPVAGGTDLLVELMRGQHADLATLVDLTRIPGLDTITVSDGGDDGPIVSVGALVTHNQVVADRRLQEMAAPLVQACREIGSPQLRNRATLVGNVVTASPANDTISALLALDAQVVIASVGGQRQVPLSAFHPGFRQTVLEPGELVTALVFPALVEPWRGVFLKLGNRRAQAISVIHLALAVRLRADTDGAGDAPVVDDVRLAVGSVGPTVERIEGAEGALRGSVLDEASIVAAAEATEAAIEPIDDVRATADYRRGVVGEMVRRALRAVASGGGRIEAEPVLLWGDGDGRWPTGPALAADHGPDTPVLATVNGQPVAQPRGAGTLLDWLRRAGLTGVKEGCAEGECGACTTHLDGLAVLSCLVPPSRAEGTEIVTVEGVSGLGSGPADALHPIQDAFIEAGAVQCGYCIPGFLVSGAKLLEERPDPTRDEVVDGLAGNLCRCTGYYKIVDAFLRVGSEQAGGAR